MPRFWRHGPMLPHLNVVQQGYRSPAGSGAGAQFFTGHVSVRPSAPTR